MTPEEHNDVILFMRRMRGISGHKVVTALNFLQFGIDFRGCSKEMMAETWAHRRDRILGHSTLENITLDMIIAKIEEVYPGGKSHMGPQPDPVKKVDIRPTKVLTSRELFEQWLTRVQSYADLRRNQGDPESYRCLDTDWLWQAWEAGRKTF